MKTANYNTATRSWWKANDRFMFEGRSYRYLYSDKNGLHFATREEDNRNCSFLSRWNWQAC